RFATNPQMCCAQTSRARRSLIKEASIGKPTDATMQASFFSNIPGTVWAEIPRYEILFHSVHYIDSIRFLFGDPSWITSRHARYPLEGRVLGETKAITVLDYDTGPQVAIAVNMCNP